MSKEDNKWIAYVGGFSFPEGAASSQRILGVTKVIALSGFDVTIVAGLESMQKGEFKDNQLLYAGKKISYEITEDTPSRVKSKIRKLKFLLYDGGKRTVNWLQGKPNKPSAVIYYGTNASFIRRLQSWCLDAGIPLIVDVVEWYDPNHLGGRLSVLNLENKHSLRFLIPKCDGVIVISSFLEQFYSKYTENIVKIPILNNYRDPQEGNKLVWEKPYRLVYAGDSGNGKKDMINLVIEQVGLRPNEFHLDVFGASYDELCKLNGFKNLINVGLGGNVIGHGRVGREEVLDALRTAHFVPLLREDKKFSQAGFPTKMVEAMSLGVPLICNLTGDMKEYVKNRNTGITISSFSDFGRTLDSITELSENEYLTMRVNARDKMKGLVPEMYVASLSALFKRLKI